MLNKKAAKPGVRPVVVLVAICIVMSGLLAFINQMTAPIIEQTDTTKTQETLNKLLPNATVFTRIECDIKGVVAVYKDDGGAGYAIITTAMGYHGDVTVTTAIGTDGKIIEISVDASGETPGIGTQTALPAYTDKFVDLEKSAAAVDAIGGATYSSRAVKIAVDRAFAAYNKVKEV